MDTYRILLLRKEARRLEASSNRLFNTAYKARYDHASKEWKEYRKLYNKLKMVNKQLSTVNAMSQNVYKTK